MDEAALTKLAVYLGDRLGPKLKGSEIALTVVVASHVDDAGEWREKFGG